MTDGFACYGRLNVCCFCMVFLHRAIWVQACLQTVIKKYLGWAENEDPRPKTQKRRQLLVLSAMLLRFSQTCEF